MELTADTIYGFNVSKYEYGNKIKLLRNMVRPDLGKHILDCALNVQFDNSEQREIEF